MFEFCGVFFFSWWSVRLKMVGNMIELNKFIFKMFYSVMFFVFESDSKISVIVI